MNRIFYILFFCITLSCSSQDREYKEISIKGRSIRVELADTPEKRRQGLMNRNRLAREEGMLFIFEEEQKMSFWMKNTSIPLSIAYISKSGVIKEIHDMTPFSEKPVYSRVSVMYALEVNQGFFQESGIKIGDLVQF